MRKTFIIYLCTRQVNVVVFYLLLVTPPTTSSGCWSRQTNPKTIGFSEAWLCSVSLTIKLDRALILATLIYASLSCISWIWFFGFFINYNFFTKNDIFIKNIEKYKVRIFFFILYPYYRTPNWYLFLSYNCTWVINLDPNIGEVIIIN